MWRVEARCRKINIHFEKENGDGALHSRHSKVLNRSSCWRWHGERLMAQGISSYLLCILKVLNGGANCLRGRADGGVQRPRVERTVKIQPWPE